MPLVPAAPTRPTPRPSEKGTAMHPRERKMAGLKRTCLLSLPHLPTNVTPARIRDPSGARGPTDPHEHAAPAFDARDGEFILGGGQGDLLLGNARDLSVRRLSLTSNIATRPPSGTLRASAALAGFELVLTPLPRLLPYSRLSLLPQHDNKTQSPCPALSPLNRRPACPAPIGPSCPRSLCNASARRAA